MKCLSNKEILAMIEIIVGILALYNYFLVDIYDEKLQDLELFKHQCISLSICFISFFYGLGTWFCFSNISMTRMLNRLHTVLVYIVLNILLFYTHSCYKINYGPKIFGYFDHGIFFDEDDRILRSYYILLCIMGFSSIVIVVNINYIYNRVIKIVEKNRNRDQ